MSQKYRANIGLGSSRGIVRSLVLGGVFACAIISLIAVTNYATSRMEVAHADHPDTRSSSNSSDKTPTATPATTLTPKSKLNAVQNQSAKPSDSTASDSAKHGLACGATTRQRIVSTYTGLIRAENKLHDDDVAKIVDSYQKTGLLTRILNPGMVSSRLTTENLRHQHILQSLTQKETLSLHNVHC